MSKLPNSIEHGAPELEPHDVTLLPADTVRYWALLLEMNLPKNENTMRIIIR